MLRIVEYLSLHFTPQELENQRSRIATNAVESKAGSGKLVKYNMLIDEKLKTLVKS